MKPNPDSTIWKVLFLCLFLTGTQEGYSQPDLTTVSGAITEHSGIPLPGELVLEEDTSIKVATDFNGNFTIQGTIDLKNVAATLIYRSSGRKRNNSNN